METPTDNQDAPTPENETVETPAEPAAEPTPDSDPGLSPEQREARYRQALEGLLFITDHALSLEKLTKLLGLRDKTRVARILESIKGDLDARDSAIQLLEVADGFQMATRSSQAPFVRKLYADRMTMRLSTAAHETLAIVAYKQPLTRAEIEQIRGVEVIAALETLLEKRLIRVVGRKETVGRPLMYGTTPDFLRHFGLRSLDDLPPIDKFAAQLGPDQVQAPPSSDPVATVVEETPAPAPIEVKKNLWPTDERSDEQDPDRQEA